MSEYIIFAGYALIIVTMGLVVWMVLKRSEKLSDILMTLSMSYSSINQDLKVLKNTLDEQARDRERESDMYKEFMISTLKNLSDRVDKADKNSQETLNRLDSDVTRLYYNCFKKIDKNT